MSWMEDVVQLSGGEVIAVDDKRQRRFSRPQAGSESVALWSVRGHVAMEWCLDRV